MNTAELLARGDFAHATLRMATAAYLVRFKGQSRVHTESDLRTFLAWCERQGLDPIETRRPHIELYLRWMQEVMGYKPSTVSRLVETEFIYRLKATTTERGRGLDQRTFLIRTSSLRFRNLGEPHRSCSS